MAMISRRVFTTSAGAALVATSGLTPTQSHAAGRKSFNYGPNKLDWYPAKSSSGNSPIVIFVHGGAWALGDRSQVHSKPEHFTASGYHFASVSYTLFPAANAQTQALQVGAAVNWVHANAARLGGDPGRIALIGHSAGCHLSALATLTGAAPPVRALVCNDTRAYDLPYLAKTSGGRLPLLYKAPFTRRSMWPAWSPISYTGLKAHPPTLVAWSSGSRRDRISRRFANALESDGVEVHRYDGKHQYNHISINQRMGSEKSKLTRAVDEFLNNTLSRVS